jgi:uncharacterized Zn-finger protein
MSVTRELDDESMLLATAQPSPGSPKAHLPLPSRAHATCPWCERRFDTIVELIDHVEVGHFTPAGSWEPTAGEVEAIVAELRPLIRSFADRDARRLQEWAEEEARWGSTAA